MMLWQTRSFKPNYRELIGGGNCDLLCSRQFKLYNLQCRWSHASNLIGLLRKSVQVESYSVAFRNQVNRMFVAKL